MHEPFGYRRFVVNALASATGRVISILMALLLATVMARLLGLQAYGTWAFFAPLIGYSGVFDFGLSIATERSVARLNAAGDLHGVSRAVNAAMTGSVVISMALLLVAWLLPPTVRAYLGEPEVVRRCLVVLTVGLVSSNLALVLGAGLSGLQQVTVLQAQRVGTAFVAVSLVVVLALAGVRRLDWLLAAYTVGPIASLVITWRLLVRALPGLRRDFFFIDWRVAWDMARFAGAIQISNLALQLGDQAFRLTLAGRFGTEFLGVYDLAYRAGQTLRSLSSSLLVVMVPFGAARSVVEGRQALPRLHALSLKYVTLFVATGTVVVLLQSRPLLQVWLGSAGEAAIMVSFLQTLLVAHGILAVAGPIHSIGRATGLARPEALMGVTGQVAGLAAALVQPDPTRALVAFTTCHIVAAAVTWRWLRRLLDVPGLSLAESVRLAGAVTAATMVAWALSRALAHAGALPIVTLIVVGGASFVVAVALAMSIGLVTADERVLWRSLVKGKSLS